MKNELDIVQDVTQKLLKLQIPFMLTGSMALNYYAQPRMTRDVDFVLELKPEQVPRFLEVFGAEYYVSSEAALTAARNRKSFSLIHQESVIKVDCFVRPDSAYAQAEFDRRKAVRIGDFETYVASKEDVIVSKLWWARASHSEVQLRDVKSLLATEYNQTYVLDWAKRLGLEELLQECLRG
ncbi:MAG: hypothetical protein HY234_02875 [Acidobacteria bacterium]|nr:hypothetical protein [Acidobacteriota bacterium]